MISAKSPSLVIIGRVDNELGLQVLESENSWFKILDLKLPTDLVSKVALLNVKDSDVYGHLAIYSTGISQVKISCITMDQTYALSRMGELVKVPTCRVKFSLNLETSHWLSFKDLPIFLGNVIDNEDCIVLVPSRLGDLLHLCIGYSKSSTIAFLKHVLNMFLKTKSSGFIINTSCVSRLPTIPLEIVLMKDNTYLLLKMYLNDYREVKPKIFMAISSNGKLVKKHVSNSIDRDVEKVLEETVNTYLSLIKY